MVATKNIFALSALAATAQAANFMVKVGTGGLKFEPATTTAQVGDTVEFDFEGLHSVVESTFESPCSPMANGFAVPAQSSGAKFTIEVTSTDPLYFYCSVASHCQAGMVGIINPGYVNYFANSARS